MKTFAMIVAAGIASSAAAQDVVITVDPSVGSVSFEYFGALPITQLWNSISVRLTGDAPITISNDSPVYTSFFFGGPLITGNGTNSVEFVGEAPGALAPVVPAPVDSSNPFSPFTFNYAGSAGAFGFELFSQNSIMFNLNPPFGDPRNLVNADNTLGPISFRVDIVPAPASAALLGLGGLAAIRRRR